MAGTAETRPLVPVPASHALLVDLLRAALECYIRGDYRRAANYWQDAAALAGGRPEALMWATLGAQLELHLAGEELVSRDAAHPAPVDPRR